MPSHEPVIYQDSRICNRDQFGDLLNEMGLLRTAVEIGTDKAAFAHTLLSRWKGAPLICVDPWDSTAGYYDRPCELLKPRETDKAIALHVLSRFPGRVEVLPMTSEAAAQYVGEVDFVYVDGDHSHQAVRTDLATWWSHLRPGGLFAGHDYNLDGVRRAVDEFVATNALGANSPCSRRCDELVSAQNKGRSMKTPIDKITSGVNDMVQIIPCPRRPARPSGAPIARNSCPSGGTTATIMTRCT